MILTTACCLVVLQGVTFKVEGGELIIARILHGGMVDQQGLLHVGDVIKEVRQTSVRVTLPGREGIKPPADSPWSSLCWSLDLLFK